MIFKTLCFYGIKRNVSFTIKMHFLLISRFLSYIRLLEMERKYAALDTDGTQLLTYVTVSLANQIPTEV